MQSFTVCVCACTCNAWFCGGLLALVLKVLLAASALNNLKDPAPGTLFLIIFSDFRLLGKLFE